MKLDRKLNLTIDVETDTGTAYIHSTPIGKAVFDSHWRLIAKAWALIMSEGLNVVAGPRIAYLAIKDTAKAMGIWDGHNSVQLTLIAEMARLTNVIYPSESGYQTMPLDTARARNIIDDDAFDEVLGKLCFFTLIFTMQPLGMLGMVITAGELWGSEITALAFTDYLNSLPTLIAEQPVNTVSSSPIAS